MSNKSRDCLGYLPGCFAEHPGLLAAAESFTKDFDRLRAKLKTSTNPATAIDFFNTALQLAKIQFLRAQDLYNMPPSVMAALPKEITYEDIEKAGESTDSLQELMSISKKRIYEVASLVKRWDAGEIEHTATTACDVVEQTNALLALMQSTRNRLLAVLARCAGRTLPMHPKLITVALNERNQVIHAFYRAKELLRVTRTDQGEIIQIWSGAPREALIRKTNNGYQLQHYQIDSPTVELDGALRFTLGEHNYLWGTGPILYGKNFQ